MFNFSAHMGQKFEETLLIPSSSQRLGGAAENLIGGSKKRICQLSLNFRFRMLLKGAVKTDNNM